LSWTHRTATTVALMSYGNQQMGALVLPVRPNLVS
jgi:hypothetical protein